MMRHARLLLVLFLVPVLLVGLVAGCTSPEDEPDTIADVEQLADDTGEEPDEGEEMAGVPDVCADDADMLGCAVIEPGKPIKIGYAGPMTGDYSAFGTDISQAGLLAIGDLGEMDGFEFELWIQDTQGSGEGGAAVANLFVSDQSVVAVAGHTFSGSTAAAIPIYNDARIPMLSPSATRADLTEGDQDVFNRIAFTDDVQGTNVAEYLWDNLGISQIGIMHDGDAYGQGLAEKVQEVFEGLGGEVVAFEPITPGEPDYTGPLNAIGAQDPEAIFYGGYDADAATLKSQMDVAGLGEAVFFSDDGTFGTNFLSLAGAKADGAYATSAVPPASEARVAFEAAYEEAYGIEAGSLSTFTWHGYDVVAALIQAVRNTAVMGDDGNLYVPREALVAGVRSLSVDGLTGEISCDASGECNTAGPTFFIVEDGEWVEAP